MFERMRYKRGDHLFVYKYLDEHEATEQDRYSFSLHKFGWIKDHTLIEKFILSLNGVVLYESKEAIQLDRKQSASGEMEFTLPKRMAVPQR
jgi:hypothetical protein